LVLPLLARPCPWKLVSWLAPRQVRPQDGHPLSAGSEVDVDADLTALTYEIASLVNRIDARTAAEQLTVSDRILQRRSRLPVGSSPNFQLGSLEPKSPITSIDIAYRKLETGFQAVQASGTGATSPAIATLIELAIAHGVPIYNDQSHLGCALIYSRAARLLLALISQSPLHSNVYELLRAASPPDSLTSENANEVAWRFRRAFDTILAKHIGYFLIWSGVRLFAWDSRWFLGLSSSAKYSSCIRWMKPPPTFFRRISLAQSRETRQT